MADEILYDYKAADLAYENMVRISKNMQGACEDMMSDAVRLLESSAGSYASGYKTKQDELNKMFEELNTEMSNRARQMQEEIDRMGRTDIKLGDGF